MSDLKQYQCHKQVGAAKIMLIDANTAGSYFLYLGGGVIRQVASDWVSTKKAEVGGYYVEYEDGYTSYSPAAAFESGYTLIP